MEIRYSSDCVSRPRVSVILLDWSCRESFHILKYLQEQTVPRNSFEIIWIEYYERKPKPIMDWLRDTENSAPPILNKWVVMENNPDVYYHKHVMYNIGILLSQGDIITICDSDAIVSETFIETIHNFFNENHNAVLHMDQIRSVDRKFYPFNYPSIEEILNSECLNLIDGKPKGIVDRSQPLHFPNYGACFSALREDLINIGGADEHIDYLGHICGPYEMTFRLVNSGKTEVWHDEEWLYHLWHPGQSGDNNYAGPHDGLHMSQTALSARRTGRVLPLVENPAINEVRLNKNESGNGIRKMLNKGVSNIDIEKWKISEESYEAKGSKVGYSKIKVMERIDSKQLEIRKILRNPYIIYNLFRIFILKTFRRLNKENKKKSNTHTHPGTNNSNLKVSSVPTYILAGISRMRFDARYMVGRAIQCLDDLDEMNVRTVSLWGDSCVADITIYLLNRKKNGIKSIHKTKKAAELYEGGREKIVITSFDDVEEKTKILKKLGIEPETIIDLW
ncbi:conserved hypothetical protein [delta proteobacterium NaphS2]|nr:conserved hypothetical protein [delta proteobacterium NaphS2]